jgi:hypothetical protein
LKLTPIIITCKWWKLNCASFHLLGLLILCEILVCACKPSEQEMGMQPPTNIPRDVSEAQSKLASGKPETNFVATASQTQSPLDSVKPLINFVATEKLYKKIKQKKIGTGGNPRFITFHPNGGILIHPGSTPSEVVFDVSGMKETLKLAFWIGQFPQNTVSLVKEGTAGFEVFVDGKSLGRKRVDRLTNETLSVDPKGASKLRIVVDDDDGVQTCDWFYMGLQ